MKDNCNENTKNLSLPFDIFIFFKSSRGERELEVHITCVAHVAFPLW